MGWENKNSKPHWGLVCATHDKVLGRTNLRKAGMSNEESILFERYLREVPDKIFYPDFPEWLRYHKHKQPIFLHSEAKELK